MKRKGSRLSVIICALIMVFLCLTSCEKHEGISYYKSKCEAELNGQYLIDQTAFNWGLGPKSPYISASEYTLEFESQLSPERGAMPLVYVYINIFVDKPWAFLTEPQTIKFVDIEDIDEEQSPWDYMRYCDDNKINCAKISWTANPKTEIVKEGTFQITEYDKEKLTYKGKFSLQFSEGSLNGEFSIY